MLETETEYARVVQDAGSAAESLEFVNGVLLAIQEEAANFCAGVATRLLQHVMGESYGFVFEPRLERGRPGLEPCILKNELAISPRDETGGGVLDVISLGLRIALWAVSAERHSPLFLLDEPGKFLDRSRVPALAEALEEIVSQMALQVVCVTHLDDLEALGLSYHIRQRNEISFVDEVTGGAIEGLKNKT